MRKHDYENTGQRRAGIMQVSSTMPTIRMCIKEQHVIAEEAQCLLNNNLLLQLFKNVDRA